jgi:DNA-binding transcriptional LysR family regulator
MPISEDTTAHIIDKQSLIICAMNKLHTSLPGLLAAVQAADSGSFTAAAKVLNLTPAAVSRNVAALEAHLQVRLFNRTTRQLSLTEEGRAFVDQARSGLAALEAAASMATQGLQAKGLVRVNCSVGFGRRFVLPLLPAFFEQHPDVQLDLSLNDQPVDLVRERFDVGIRGGSQPPDGMVARKICNITSMLVASPRYLRAHGTPQHYSELAGHHLLRVKFLTGRLAPWLFKDKGRVVAFEGPAKLLISDPEMILDAALLHMGIARIGGHHAFNALQRGDLVTVLPRQQAPSDAAMTIFYPHRAGLAPRVRVLVDFLLKRLADVPALRGV